MNKQTIEALNRARDFLMNVHPAIEAEASIRLERVEYYLGLARDTSAKTEAAAKDVADIGRLREMQSMAKAGHYGNLFEEAQ